MNHALIHILYVKVEYLSLILIISIMFYKSKMMLVKLGAITIRNKTKENITHYFTKVLEKEVPKNCILIK